MTEIERPPEERIIRQICFSDGNKVDRIRPNNDARVSWVYGDLHRYSIMAGAD